MVSTCTSDNKSPISDTLLIYVNYSGTFEGSTIVGGRDAWDGDGFVIGIWGGGGGGLNYIEYLQCQFGIVDLNILYLVHIWNNQISFQFKLLQQKDQ